MPHMFSDIAAFRHDPLLFLLQRASSSYGPLERLHMGPKPVYLVTDPDLIKPLMKADIGDFDKGRLIKKLREVVGSSSLTIGGEAHLERRQVIHEQLAKGAARAFVPLLASLYRKTITQLVKEGTFGAHEITGPLALRVICAVLFGKDALSTGDENALIRGVHLVEDDLADDMFRILPHLPWAYLRKKRKLAEAKRLMKLVVGRAQKNAKDSSLLRALEVLDLTQEELEDEILMILLAGHHTTGTAAAWVLHAIAADPALQSKLSKEVVATSSSEGELRADLLPKAKVSLALVKEVLRLYPSAWWFSRETTRALSFGGINLPKGTSVLVSPWQMHRDDRFWIDPHSFCLDRDFSHPAYVPFGAGPRACVGLRMATLELQMLALEFSAATDMRLASSKPPAWPKPSVTLVPPKIEISIQPQQQPQRVAA